MMPSRRGHPANLIFFKNIQTERTSGALKLDEKFGLEYAGLKGFKAEFGTSVPQVVAQILLPSLLAELTHGSLR
jgi:hypothetical protein